MTLKVRWVASPNYTPGRAGHNPMWTKADPNTWIVLHTQVGRQAASIASFQSPARQASSTYLVALDGSIVQMVKETDAPWTNGTMAGIGSNLDSITIEHEDGGDYNGPRTPALYEASAQLVADIARRRGIPLIHRGAGGGVLRHRECQGAATACPDSLDIGRIIARAVVINTPPKPAPPPPVKPPTPPIVPPFVVPPPVLPPLVVAPVTPPVIVNPPTEPPAVVFTPVPEAPPGGWAAFFAWIKRVLGIS